MAKECEYSWGELDMADVPGGPLADTLDGSDDADELDGMGGNDILRAYGGDDGLYGGNGNDTLLGGAGFDYLIGGRGADVINGGADDDQVSYEDSPSGINLNLGTGVATDGFGFTDTLISIEQARGSMQNDILIGNGGDNRLMGLMGNDTLYGGGGTRDMLRYDRDTSYDGDLGVFVDLQLGQAQDGFGDIDTIGGFERVRGTYTNDTLRGDANANQLEGEGGDDLIEGRGGNDDLLGRTGNDTINGGSGDDYIEGGSGDDVINGGDGFDTIAFMDEDATPTGVRIEFTGFRSGFALDWSGSTDTFQNIERGRGTNFDDTLIGNSGDEELSGEGGDDYITGGDGNDYLEGGDGDDTLDGSTGSVETSFWGDFMAPGFGSNTIIGHEGLWDEGDGIDIGYDNTEGSGGINVQVGANGTGTVTSNGPGLINDTFTYAHYFIGTEGIDTFTRTGDDDRWFAFRGLEGNDTFYGGDVGRDQVDYSRDANRGGTAGVTVNLLAGIGIDGFGDTDSLIDIEEVQGTDFGDRLTGDNDENSLLGRRGSDTLNGNGGDDYLEAGGGNDSLSGGDGDDYLAPGAGTDTIRGGTGFDTIEYYDEGISKGLTINASAAAGTNVSSGTIIDWTGATDTFSGIEAFSGTEFADTFIGGTGSQDVYGNGGTDTLRGGAGDDYFQGGEGNDRINGEADWDFVSYYWDRPFTGIVLTQINATTMTVQDGLGFTDTLISIEGVEGTNFADTFTGGAGEQFFRGLGGDDTINGGAGTLDWIAYNNTARKGGFQGVVANFNTGIATDTFGDTDSFSNIEGFWGSELGDNVTGKNGTAHRFVGNEGDDTLIGASGNDTLEGDDGNDLPSSATTGTTSCMTAMGMTRLTAGQALICFSKAAETTRFMVVQTMTPSILSST